MKLFECQGCGNPVHFDNTVCVECGRALGYMPWRRTITALEAKDHGLHALEPGAGRVFLCDNARSDACNWLLPEADGPGLCRACRHNRMIPDLSLPQNLAGWKKIEAAKKHLFWSLTAWPIWIPTRVEDPHHGLAFDFLADVPAPGGWIEAAVTGHAAGVITISVAEADDAERERRRTEFGEPYRTLLGHFRHEFGHYAWSRLVAPEWERLAAFRDCFGDERQDYPSALSAHYRNGPPPDWQSRAVSAYATAHPWEDFAETFAHYVHMVDGLETARAYGLAVRPRIRRPDDLAAKVEFDPYRAGAVSEIVEGWVPLTVALNAMNRSLGQPDLYPFVLSAPAVAKLGFVHRLVRGEPS